MRKKNYIRWFSLAIMKPSILVGGQAVIEGVMMRVPGAYATAARSPEGTVHIDRHEFRSRTEISPWWKKPVLRGMISLFEAMKMGMQTLQWSAGIAYPEESSAKNAPASWREKIQETLGTLFAIALALTLFMIAPYWITTRWFGMGKEAVLFNILAGGLRILFFVLYLWLISLMRDVRRLFQYHGAEHRVVYNFESGQDISIATAQTFPTPHPRCGTSFMFIVLLSAIIMFAVIDSLLISLIGPLSVSLRLVVHLPLIPLVAGISYEVIKLTARHGDRWWVRGLRAPGLWLQRITTSPPEDDMVEVSITALKSAFGDQYEEKVGREYVAEAIG